MECMRNQLKEGVVLSGRYQVVAPLNHGSFGMVFQAKDLVSSDLVAIKCLTKPTATAACQSPFAVDDKSEELSVHLRIGAHPNIVNLLDSFETPNHSYLVLEYCANGDLYEAIRQGKGPLETQHVRDFMLQLVDAVEYMHAHGIYHRDLKPENLFLAQSGSIKIGDFGLATTNVWSYEVAVGSDRYMAPEQYEPACAGYATFKADVWAMGICLLNVLFSRNPFAVPSVSDPLFADFALDRQTLFDVFPTMSQDTFQVLVHCLAIDPAKRDLSLVREALERVISFTTDDETLDEFCTEDREAVAVTAHRQPLRTPSLSTPQLDQGGSFAWAKALALSPPQPVRQLSAIPDTEPYPDDLFADAVASRRGWFDAKPDTASSVSLVDSGLGLSFKSTDVAKSVPFSMQRTKPMPIVGSLPADAGKGWCSLASLGRKRDYCSKSWSELFDEEVELHLLSETENDYLPDTAQDKPWTESRDGSGVSTPRGGLAEIKNPAATNCRSRSPKNRRVDERVSDQTGFLFEEHPVARYSPPSKRTALDKWAALGDRRRGQPATPQKSLKTIKSVSALSTSAKKRSRVNSYRRPAPWGVGQETDYGVPERREHWSLSKDWRRHPDFSDDIGDLEWVGGWHDLHL